MASRLKTRVGKFVVRTRVPDAPEISGKMTTLEKIAWMKEHNPRAKLIPFSPTYYKAVEEMNLKMRGTMIRPEVPEWFCGHVNKEWPYFEDDDDNRMSGDDMFSGMGDQNASGDNDGYPWDQCCEYGMEPNTPGYMWCDEPELYAVNGDDSFLHDFTMDVIYEEATFPEGSGDVGGEDCDTKEDENGEEVPGVNMPSRSGEWCCGGWHGGRIGAADVTISAAGISGRTMLSWAYSAGQAIVDGWGVNNTIVCLGLFAEGKWYTGKIDWVKSGQTRKNLKNVKCGYNGWAPGALNKATKGKCCVCNASSHACSNWFEFTI